MAHRCVYNIGTLGPVWSQAEDVTLARGVNNTPLGRAPFPTSVNGPKTETPFSETQSPSRSLAISNGSEE